jgi:hypothetical protein
MSTWIILSWVFVAILTTVNVVIFLKLKSASEQMLKMAFPNAKNMGDALSQMQGMMGGMGMGGMGGMPNMAGGKNRLAGSFGGAPGAGAGAGGKANMDAQLKQAMSMLQNIQKKQGR